LWVILTGQSLPIQGRAEFARFGGDLGEPAGEPGGFVALLQATELGVQFTTFNLNEFGEKPSGVGGGRFGCYVSSHISLDTEVNHFPENPSGNFGETLALFGVKVGKRFDRLGVFAKARPGVIHFGGGDFSQRLRDKTHLAVDLGGVLEYGLSPHIFVRFDLGDTIIAFGGATFLSAVSPGPTRLGTIHNLQASIGLGIRF
jgi:hypothetical protein